MHKFFLNCSLLIVNCSLLIAMISCGKRQPPPIGPVPVNLITVKARPVVYYDRYTANTVALSQVNLLAQVQGYITKIYFREGTHVTKGQKLYDIDRRLYEDNYNSALANLKVAEGNLKEAQQDADRYSYLNSKNAVAKQVYDHAVITLENAQNQYKASEQLVNMARTNLTYSEITAPFNGTIGFSMVKLGDFMNVGQTILNTVSTDAPMAVDFLINEKQLTYFQKLQQPAAGSQQSAKKTDSLFTIILPDNSIYPKQGEISVIDRSVDPQTGAMRIRLVFPNPDYKLRAGMSCVVRVRNQDTSPQLLIPNKAVVEQMGEYFVYIVKDTVMVDKSNQHSSVSSKSPKTVMIAVEKKVHPGTVIGANIIIIDGIKEGDRLIVDGVQSIHDGSLIIAAPKKQLTKTH